MQSQSEIRQLAQKKKNEEMEKLKNKCNVFLSDKEAFEEAKKSI